MSITAQVDEAASERLLSGEHQISDTRALENEPKAVITPEGEQTVSGAIVQAMRYRRHIRFIAIVASLVIASIAGLVTGLLVYTFAAHTTMRDGSSAVISSADLQYVITLSQMVSTLVIRTVPVVITLHAYHVASDWLRQSRVPGSRERPSPLQ